MPPQLIIMDRVVLLGVIFFKMKCVCKTQMPDHKKVKTSQSPLCELEVLLETGVPH
jgi:hypothetical protein